MRTLGLFLKMARLRFLAAIEYPGSYSLGIIAQWFVYGMEFLTVYLMVNRFGTLRGWLPMQTLFLYAFTLMTYALGASFTFNLCRQMPQLSVEGALDEAMVKPIRPLLFLMGMSYNVGYLSHFALAFLMMALAAVKLSLHWALWQWAWLVVSLISASAMQSALMLSLSLPSIKARANSPWSNLYWNLRDAGFYPLSIFPEALRVMLVVVVPFGFISFLPVQPLLGIMDTAPFPPAFQWGTPVVALLMVGVCALVWMFTLRRYESAGS